jgi:RimJ/RimL family protein N-acetyltransferase
MYIETERLILRDFAPTDLACVHDLHMRPETIRYNPSGYPESEDASRQFVMEWAAQQGLPERRCYTAAVIDKAYGSFAGIISLELGKPKYCKAEVWYKILPEYWGKGIATEALTGILHFGFCILDLHRIECGCSIRNGASFRVMEKAGMKREGMKRQVLPLEDGWHDAYMYGILKDEFTALNVTL